MPVYEWRSKDGFDIHDDQQNALLNVMRDSGWWTLKELATATGQPKASIYQRLRMSRNEKFGDNAIETKRSSRGDWMRRLNNGRN